MFTYTKEELIEKKAINTAEEINQQPDVWEKVWGQGAAEREKAQKFIKEIFNQHVRGRVIFTGAGTSAFIGDMLVPELIQHLPAHVQVEATPTTELVSNPKNYFREDIPTVLVSFGRSGNSPESVAATELGQKIVDDFYQIVITCNEDGTLARNIEEDENSKLLLLPPETHDKGFAMTSSFSAMALTAYLIFAKENVYEDHLSAFIANARHALKNLDNIIDQVLTVDFERLVYLGSGTLGQASHEAALKMLELTAGKVVALHESSLGFRHGPKSVLNKQSVAVVLVSRNPYTRKYDLDMIKELSNEDALSKVIALTDGQDEEVKQLADLTFVMAENPVPNDFFLSLNYMLFAQVLSLRTSLKLGITPDNPSPEGSLNRVVQGVTIYDY